MDTVEPSAELDGVLRVKQLARILKVPPDTIRRHVRLGVFPIKPLKGLSGRTLRFSGPVVRSWLERNGSPRRARPLAMNTPLTRAAHRELPVATTESAVVDVQGVVSPHTDEADHG